MNHPDLSPGYAADAEPVDVVGGANLVACRVQLDLVSRKLAECRADCDQLGRLLDEVREDRSEDLARLTAAAERVYAVRYGTIADLAPALEDLRKALDEQAGRSS